ncbi:carbohydrate porin [Tolypothrix sp. FACHB-123]|uniref:iron uptake porin n=1 Tax=Tolypothrix sp. FACHB-123 TaxID=2692868 RepID=UPI00168502F4|nr:iron uptake porin [Tolypothrix sp. FACHB-123]MBD2355646.1 carbohydrate porin [Tolypothrix sp. FACHB-123]
MLKHSWCSFLLLFLASPAVWAADATDAEFNTLQEQVTSVSQFSDVQPTDWAFAALQSLVERYGCIAGYPNSTYRGNRALTRYEFAAGLNACLDRINELITTATSDLVQKQDLAVLQKLQQDFAAELTTLRGRVDSIEARTSTLEQQQFSTTTKLNAQIITAISDTFGNKVGGTRDESNPFFATRGRLQLESSFTGKDLLRVRLEFGNFANSNGVSQIAAASGTGMTRLNFDNDSNNTLFVPHIRYYFPVSESLSFVIGPVGIGYNDITDNVTPATVADDGNGIPSLFGKNSLLFERGGGGAAVNWKISSDLVLTLGYLANSPNNPAPQNGLFDGGYNALAHLVYYGQQGAIGVAYSHGYSPAGTVDITGSRGSALSISPFGNSIATSNSIVGAQGYYRFSPNFQVHAWGGYIWATAKNSGFSDISNGRGSTDSLFVNNGDSANAWFGAIGMTFPDVGGRGNLPGILFGLPPRVSHSDVREESDSSYHIEAFYRWRIHDNISVTPGFWVILNPENNSNNDTQYVGVLRTTFDF